MKIIITVFCKPLSVLLTMFEKHWPGGKWELDLIQWDGRGVGEQIWEHVHATVRILFLFLKAADKQIICSK